jgi:hypothetical protein
VKSNEPPEFKPTNWYDLPLEVGMDPAGSLCTPPHDAASQHLLAQHNKMSIEISEKTPGGHIEGNCSVHSNKTHLT